MIEGILVANEATGVQADQIRSALWLAVAAPTTVEAEAA